MVSVVTSNNPLSYVAAPIASLAATGLFSVAPSFVKAAQGDPITMEHVAFLGFTAFALPAAIFLLGSVVGALNKKEVSLPILSNGLICLGASVFLGYQL